VRLGVQFAEMSVRVWKAPNSSKTVFCIHNYVFNSKEFDYLASYLSDHGYNVICPDLLGRGSSGNLKSASQYHLLNMLKSLGSIFERYASSENFMLGSSYGGALALLAASSGLTLSGLILNDPPLAPHPDRLAYTNFLQELCQTGFADEQEFVNWLTPIMDREIGPFPEGALERFVKNNTAKRNSGYGLSIDSKLAEVVAGDMNMEFDLIPRLKAVNAPVLLLFASNSPYRHAADLSFLEKEVSRITLIDNITGNHPPLLIDEGICSTVRRFLDESSPA
jgi:pimeloyl-ACP methyl ester carboxylesterase